ncbi:MAG: tRNA pseudouridine(55) synthase TruB [Pseudomonadota bacterium]|nr:tRNA pseudouridine(55) synthase TruB [Pseudomonadota bacterium]
MTRRARNRHGRELHGILLLDKPTGLTSNSALQRIKRFFKASKAGHTGSLDPLATGMLPICFGAGTKISSFLLDAHKRYRVTGLLGSSTDSGDADGKVISEGSLIELKVETVREVLAAFEGEIEQIPPMYSALKHKGRRLYELAREGTEVVREVRRVRILSIDLLRCEWPELVFNVTCSKGTYVRTLVEDIAKALGTLGHVIQLRRLAVEPFEEHQMVNMEALEAGTQEGLTSLDQYLLPIDAALTKWPRVVVEAELCESLTHGQSVPAQPDWPQAWVRVYSSDNIFLGIGEVRMHGQLVPRRIFPAMASFV